jgi:glutamate/tyrosine decarboxylase-like PLP-dependent enzyme
MGPSREGYASALGGAAELAHDYLATLPTRAAARIDAPPPRDPLPRDGLGERDALARFRARYEAALSGSPGPRYWGFVTGGSTPAALAGDWLAAAYDQNVSNDVGSLAAAVERETLAWLRELFALPDAYAGAFVSGATAANTVALACARQHLLLRSDHDAARDGLAGAPPLRVYAGAAHSSIDKALAILGLGRRALVRLPTLPGRSVLDPDALAARLAEAGAGPAIVVASAGEVNTGDFDDLRALSAIARRHGAWLHVDGAFGLYAALVPALAERLAGIDGADSITVDLHKWLNVPYDAAVVYTRHPQRQREVYRASSSYLGDSDDPLHLTPENSRRFRALPAWISLAAYGRAGVARWVERNCALARALGAGIAALPGLELLSPVHLNVVCFAPRAGGSAERDRLLERLTRDGRVFLTPTVLHGRPALRAALSNWSTSEADVAIALAALRDALAA